MEYAIILRKLEIEGQIYYQAVEKVSGEKDIDDSLNIIEGYTYKNNKISSSKKRFEKDVFYYHVSKDNYQKLTDEDCYTILFKESVNGMIAINNTMENDHVLNVFFEIFNDFRIIPNIDIEAIFTNLSESLKRKILGQETDNIVRQLKTNQMYKKSNLDPENIKRNLTNILIYGPLGTGKSTIVDTIFTNCGNIPIVKHKLIGEFNKDIVTIINKLILAASGDFSLAMQGIVIFDGINDLGDGLDCDTDYYLDILEQILDAQKIIVEYPDKERRVFDYSLVAQKNIVKYQDRERREFDYSLVTNIVTFDIGNPYHADDKEESFIEMDDLYDAGFSDRLMSKFFNGKFLIKPVTPELALKILKKKAISPLQEMRTMLQDNGRKLVAKDGFIEKLIDYGLGYGKGF